MRSQCKLSGCDKIRAGQGYCNKHYKRLKATGDPLGTKIARAGYKHGMSRTPTWYSWVGMIERATNKKYKQYKDYAGRGIKVCDRWTEQKGFLNFLADMGERPEGMTLDRIDNDGNYEPDNCRWATYSQQRVNSRPRKRVADV